MTARETWDREHAEAAAATLPLSRERYESACPALLDYELCGTPENAGDLRELQAQKTETPTIPMAHCPKCGYEWQPRVASPKECSRCKKRLPWKTA